MILNGAIALILHFSPNLIALLANNVTVVEDRLIMSVNIVSQFQSSTFGHPAARSLAVSAIAELLFTSGINARGVAKYSDFGPVEGYISETVQDEVS